MFRFICIVAILFCSCHTKTCYDYSIERNEKFPWADSVIRQMTPEERIAQLLFVRSFPDGDARHTKAIIHLINDIKPGGIVFFKGTTNELLNQIALINKSTIIPIFYGMDAENGLGMRLGDVEQLPVAKSLGEYNNDSLSYVAGMITGAQFNSLGLHINFAPVADINYFDNEITAIRSYGSKKEKVSTNALAFMKGLKSRNVISVAKHFPGHGFTYIDSHLKLPVLLRNADQLDSCDLGPFKDLIRNGIDGVMMGHLLFPLIDERYPASLSECMTKNLLREKLKFDGLIFTDALNMKALVNYQNIEVKALMAGADVLLFPKDIEQCISEIMEAIEVGKITMRLIDQKCLKVLQYKERYGLNVRRHFVPKLVEMDSLNREIRKVRQCIQ